MFEDKGDYIYNFYSGKCLYVFRKTADIFVTMPESDWSFNKIILLVKKKKKTDEEYNLIHLENVW